MEIFSRHARQLEDGLGDGPLQPRGDEEHANDGHQHDGGHDFHVADELLVQVGHRGVQVDRSDPFFVANDLIGDVHEPAGDEFASRWLRRRRTEIGRLPAAVAGEESFLGVVHARKMDRRLDAQDESSSLAAAASSNVSAAVQLAPNTLAKAESWRTFESPISRASL